MIRRAFLAFIHFYQRFISPLKSRPTCRFLPTCSEYAKEAIEIHGAWRGGWKALWRLLRCQPLCKGGFDPVVPPETREGHVCEWKTKENVS
jgi:hypothetical protein